MTALPKKIASFYISNASGCPIRDKQIVIQMAAPSSHSFAYALTDKFGKAEVEVENECGKVIVDGVTVHYGSLTNKRIDIKLREICPELPD